MMFRSRAAGGRLVSARNFFTPLIRVEPTSCFSLSRQTACNLFSQTTHLLHSVSLGSS
jgi:hypothetical protein